MHRIRTVFRSKSMYRRLGFVACPRVPLVSFGHLDELVVEKERCRHLTEEIEQTVSEIQGS